MKTWMKVAIAGAALVVVVPLAAGIAENEARPVGSVGPQAEALADKMLAAVNADAWARTGAVRWRMAEGRPLMLWDRQRGLVEVRQGEGADALVMQFDTGRTQTLVRRGGQPVTGEEAKALVDRAWADFINDSFWLNAPTMIKNDGTARAIVTDDEGHQSLLVSYASGGATPGDAYLWHLDESGKPKSGQMWVGILPIGGLEVSWSDYTALSSGALIARRHEGPLGISMTHDPLESADSAAALNGGEDPFAALVGAVPVSAEAGAEATPASRPAAD